ncbi:hypothetical protein FT663_04772 [Candidozyma haemuli var. vulneris]|uniref:candidapepsin n=1 Tax=Candidozyma haemuli TaxID=45357 RepID=A0A2V1B131_9ASCO|nr:hypothetical protein CXQ85_003160 [[Candida] haemuloni]KAF3986699.1 hypothetical protein FT663_04772 [[Candida] haemuloni var. vulneris]KAF3986800.1 hypothetical protein FT662_04364 [[Candida] haemuloni var. vulneris]PVH23423.1 hypothetical protein CXQ85_003160 [[Candida] haemuloni]
MLPFLTIFSLALAFTSALVVPENHADSLQKRNGAPLKLDFTVKKTFNESTPAVDIGAKAQELTTRLSLSKRHETASLTNDRDITYLLDLKLGSNKQPVTVLLDTGSSDLWVYGPKIQNPQGGSFDPSKSSANKKTGEDFFISYLDGSYALGEYVTDDFALEDGRNLLNDLQFAVVDRAQTNSQGILGVADKNQEATDNQYDNLPWALQKSGVTPKASYSLYLGSEAEGKGSIIFGGIDTEKYEGDLTKYPVAGTRGLALNVESAEVAGQTIDLDAEILLDSGTSLNLWPQHLIDAVGKELGGTLTQGFYFVDCDQPTDKHLTFDFGKNKINVSYQDLVWKSQGYCLLGVQPGTSTLIFGDVFLRSAYVYYDLSQKEISIAQAKYTDASNIVAA